MPISDVYQFVKDTTCKATYQADKAPATKCRLRFTGLTAPIGGNIKITDDTGTVYSGALRSATPTYDITGDSFRVTMTSRPGVSTQVVSFSCSDAEFDLTARNISFGTGGAAVGMYSNGDYGECNNIVCPTNVVPTFIGSWSYS